MKTTAILPKLDDKDFDATTSSLTKEDTHKTILCKPFVKWVGGKRSILDELISRIPKSYTNYHEPFVGGGALFFEHQPEKAYLSDINPFLIQSYKAIKNDVDKVIEELENHKKKHSREYYLKLREKLFPNLEDHIIAGLFIYLNKTCYNGLYRVNKAGKFNVPIGSYTKPSILDKENLINCSKSLQKAQIEINHFYNVEIKEHDFVYLDPPFYGTFDQYDPNKFVPEQHEKLASFCEKIQQKKAKFMLSNSDNEFIRNLYKKFNIEIVKSKRFISCKANQRGSQPELIIRNYE